MRNSIQIFTALTSAAFIGAGCAAPYSGTYEGRSHTHRSGHSQSYASIPKAMPTPAVESSATAPPAAEAQAVAAVPSVPARAYVPATEPVDVRPASVTAIAPVLNDAEHMPPNAKPGECYARVLAPPTYASRTENVLVKASSSHVEIVPAKYEWAEEQVTVKEASEELTIIPAEYKTVEEKVMVEPATREVVEVPPEFEEREERVLVKPAHTVWKKGRGPLQKLDDATGEIMCLVEVPAVYETVKRKVLKADATTRTVEKPARYEMVTRNVMTSPARTIKKVIPAEFKTVKVRKMVSAAEERSVTVPATFDTIEKRVMVSPGRMTWKRVLCETNLSPDIIKQIQKILAENGYTPGEADGALGPQTRLAIETYQADKELAVGGLTFETLRQLGITLEENF